MTDRLVAALLVSCLLIEASYAQTDSFNNNNNSFNNNYCTALGNGDVIICNPPRVGFSEVLGKQLIYRMPDKGKKVTLKTVGNGIDQAIGNQVQQFLVEHGYVVARVGIGMLVPPPNGPYTLQIGPDRYVLTIAPSAH